MKKISVPVSVAFFLLCMAVSSFAQENAATSIPRLISYQGYVTDAFKNPLSGEHLISVKLYDAPTGGNLLHGENFIPAVDRGVFSVTIGSIAPLETSLPFDKQYWLGVSVDGREELSPRTAFTSAPYAIRANEANALAKNATGVVRSLNGNTGSLVLKAGAGIVLESDNNTITISALHTSANGVPQIQVTSVTSVSGTANQITANPTTGAVVLSLPQNINNGASPTFSGITLSNLGTGIVHSNGGGSLSSSLISNADIAAGANIAASKLNLTNAITSGDIASGTIVNSDINAGANIAASKLNLTNAITSGDIVAGTIMNSDINSNANISYSKLNLVGSISNVDIAGNATISDTKLATITAAGKVANSATTATANNAANAIVHRDGSGNFSAGTITATLNGNATNVSGIVEEVNGGTGISTYSKGDILYASAVNTLSKRGIGATGQVLTVTGGVPVWSALSGVGVTSATGTVNQVLVNGGSGTQTTGGITLSLPQDIHSGASPTFAGMTLSNLNTSGIIHNSSAGVISTSLVVDADVSAAAAIADSKLSTISTSGKVANSATTATSTNTINTIILRDASGNFSAGTINIGAANITGKATSASTLAADAATTLATKDYVDNIATEYWSVTGNNGLSATNYFGTSDASNLSIRTNGIERMKLASDGSLLLSGNSGAVPVAGAGTRMMWVPSLGAFRAGKASGSEWNAGNVGAQSVAMGYGNLASGSQSVAMGFFSSAYGMGSIAIGSGAAAFADAATAFGSGSQAVGYNSVAMGDNSTAWSDDAVAIGSNTSATGFASTALGANTSTNGSYGMATGKNLTVGLSSFGFNGSTTNAVVNVSGINNFAYFGDVDLAIGNDDNTARSLRFYGSNSSSTLSGAHYTSFKAGTQSANITYTLPTAQGASNSLFTNDGSGTLSWSTLSSLNILAGSALYYDNVNNRLGIGTTTPAQVLDVTGNANVTGTITSGSGITTNGITMSGGSAVLSYGTVSAGAAIAIPNSAVVKINDDGATTVNSITLPPGTNGQIIYIFNNDADPTTGDATLASGATGTFFYADGWHKTN